MYDFTRSGDCDKVIKQFTLSNKERVVFFAETSIFSRYFGRIVAPSQRARSVVYLVPTLLTIEYSNLFPVGLDGVFPSTLIVWYWGS